MYKKRARGICQRKLLQALPKNYPYCLNIDIREIYGNRTRRGIGIYAKRWNVQTRIRIRKSTNHKKITANKQRYIYTRKELYTSAKKDENDKRGLSTQLCLYLIPRKPKEMHVRSMVLFHSGTPWVNFVHCWFSPN